MMIIKIKVFFLIFGLSYFPFDFVAAANYKIQVTNMKCFNVDPKYFKVITCKLVAARNTRGPITIVIETVQPIDDLHDHIQFFTRTSTGRLQPWMNIDLNACDAPKLAKLGRLFEAFYKFFDKMIPNLKNGCPFSGTFNLTRWEMDKEIGHILPPIVTLEGKFVGFHRVFIGKTNQTILEAKFAFEVRPIGTDMLMTLG